MNHRPSGSLTVSKAVEGFLSFKIAEGLSNRTDNLYARMLPRIKTLESTLRSHAGASRS